MGNYYDVWILTKVEYENVVQFFKDKDFKVKRDDSSVFTLDDILNAYIIKARGIERYIWEEAKSMITVSELTEQPPSEKFKNFYKTLKKYLGEIKHFSYEEGIIKKPKKL